MLHNDPFNVLFQELVTRATDPQSGRWTPAVDAYVAGEKLHLEVLLPGVDPKAVELMATGNRLTIKGTRERHAPKDARDLRMNEVVYGKFERTLELPEGTDLGKAEAHFENGVLQVRLPALGSFVPRKIEIGTTVGGKSLSAA